MNHLNPKSLAFYGIAISSVLILFKTVTIYGDKNLAAPPRINSPYQLTFANNLSNCEQINTWQLNIEQSGVYVNGVLSPVTTDKNPHHQLNLSGTLKNQELSLSGKVNDFSLCQLTHAQKNLHHNLTMQMSLVKKDYTTGQLNIDNSSAIKFTAVPVKSPAQTSKLNSH